MLLSVHAEKLSEEIDGEKDKLIFKTFDKKEENITPKSPLSFKQCARVKVYFERYFPQAMIAGNTRLVITPEL